MPRRDDQHGIEHEPHLNPEAGQVDPSESRADKIAQRRPTVDDSGRIVDAWECPRCGYDRRGQSIDTPCTECGCFDEERARHAVFNEPGAIFPESSVAHRTGVADRDWSCDHCGYNVRGLEIGSRCPECGKTSIYQPAPLDRASYASWLKEHLGRPQPAVLLTILGLIVAGGIGSVISSLFLEMMFIGGELLSICVFAPVVEESMKIGVLAIILERYPHVLRSRRQIIVVGIGSALLFASIENAMYLLLYVAQPTGQLIVWRWTICVAMHVGCSLIGTLALASVWSKSINELREPDLVPFYRALILAIVIHGVYNGTMVLFELSGLWF